MADFKINVIVDPTKAVRGVKTVNNELNKTSKTVDRLRGLIKRAFVFAGATLGIRQIFKLADAYTILTNRIAVATDGAAFSGQILKRVFGIANSARQPIAQLAALYQRVSVASGELGASQEDVLKFVGTTAQALAIQGGATAEAAGALTQLSQALGNAKIQAQEFNSLVDGAFPLLQAAARGIDAAGGSVSKLRQLVLQGRLSNEEFFRGVLSQSESVASIFSKTSSTVGQAVTVLNNNLTKYIGETDSSIGITNLLAQSIILLSNNLEILDKVLGGVIITILLYKNAAAIAAATTFISTQIQLAKAVLGGRAALIQGVAADRARAASAVAAAEAEAVRTASVLAGTRAELARSIVVKGNAKGEFARLAILKQINILEKQNAAASAAVVAAQTKQLSVVGLLGRSMAFLRTALAGALALIGGIPGLIVAATAALVFFSDRIDITSDGVATLADLAVVSFDALVDAIRPAIILLQEIGADILKFIEPVASAFKPAIKAVKEFFDEIDFSLAGVLRVTARTVDKFIGLWLGAFSSLKQLFITLPSIIGSAAIIAINGVISGVESLINVSIRAINVLSEIAGIDPIAEINLSGVENTFAGASEGLGAAMKEAFLKGFDNNSLENLINTLLDAAEERARKRIALLNETVDKLPDAAVKPIEIGPDVQRELDLLEEQARLLKLNGREREIQNAIFQVEQKLRRDLNSLELEAIDTRLRTNQLLKDQATLLEELNGPQEELIIKQQTLNALYNDGDISATRFANALMGIRIEQSQLNIDGGEGTFADGFIVGIDQMLDAVRNFESEAGATFADFFSQTTEGFATATADAIVFGDNIGEALGNVARRALADLLGGLIKLGLQFVLNSALGQTLSATTTATSVASAAVIAAAWAPAAAATSLASFGANAAPAAAGIASTFALSTALSVVPGLMDGGPVSGPGGPRSDMVPRMLSNGEFVVNAKSAARFRPLLEQINNPRAMNNGGEVNTSAPAVNSSNQQQNGSSGESSIRIINNLDPKLVGDFLDSAEGDKVIVNKIERNASSIQQILRNS